MLKKRIYFYTSNTFCSFGFTKTMKPINLYKMLLVTQQNLNNSGHMIINNILGLKFNLQFFHHIILNIECKAKYYILNLLHEYTRPVIWVMYPKMLNICYTLNVNKKKNNFMCSECFIVGTAYVEFTRYKQKITNI